MGKVNNRHEVMASFRREMEAIKMNQLEMLNMKKTISEMMNPFDRMVAGLKMTPNDLCLLVSTPWCNPFTH